MVSLQDAGFGTHAGQHVYTAGAPLEAASSAMVLLHGRGGSAPDILGLSASLKAPGLAFLAPQAASNTWYPHRFLEPTSANEPHLSSALATAGRVLAAVEAAGIPAERVIVLGFSQGACLAAEFVARNPRRYGGLAVLSGGLIGTEAETERHAGDLAGTPTFVGCSDVDFHIPLPRVQTTTLILRAMGATVDETIYPGMGHGIVEDEILKVRDMVAGLMPERNR